MVTAKASRNELILLSSTNCNSSRQSIRLYRKREWRPFRRSRRPQMRERFEKRDNVSRNG